MGAVLACGEGAVVSHRSAAELWGLLEARPGPVKISVPTTAGRGRRADIRLHRRVSLPASTTTRRLGIPVTTAAQTLADLRRVVSPAELRRVIRQAEVRGL